VGPKGLFGGRLAFSVHFKTVIFYTIILKFIKFNLINITSFNKCTKILFYLNERDKKGQEGFKTVMVGRRAFNVALD